MADGGMAATGSTSSSRTLLFAYAASQPRIRILNRTEFEELTQDERGVTAIARDLDSGERISRSHAVISSAATAAARPSAKA